MPYKKKQTGTKRVRKTRVDYHGTVEVYYENEPVYSDVYEAIPSSCASSYSSSSSSDSSSYSPDSSC